MIPETQSSNGDSNELLGFLMSMVMLLAQKEKEKKKQLSIIPNKSQNLLDASVPEEAKTQSDEFYERNRSMILGMV